MLLLCLASASGPAAAAQLLLTDVMHAHGRYTVRFALRMAASPDRVAYYLTDYARYAEYFDTVTESRVQHTAAGREHVSLKLSACVLFFCKTVRVVQDVERGPDGSLRGRIDPVESDFHASEEHWRWRAADGGTQVEYEAELAPSFYVPPVIGPLVMKYKIREILSRNAERLEQLAQR